MIHRFDDYSRADNAGSLDFPSDGGAGYTLFSAGSFGVESHHGYSSVPTVRGHAVLSSPASDVDVQVTLDAIGNGGPVFRWASVDQYFQVAVETTGLTLYIYNFGYTVIGTPYSATIPPGSVVRANAVGSAINIYLGGSLVISTVNANFLSASSHGIQAYNDTVTRFAAFSIADPAGVSVAPTFRRNLNGRAGSRGVA